MNLPLLLGVAAALRIIGTALSIAAPVLVAPRSRLSAAAWSFFWWLVLGAISNIVSALMVSRGMNNQAVLLTYRLLSVLLLGITGYRLLTIPKQRQLIVGITILYVVLWLGLTLTGVEPPHAISRYTSPGEKIVFLVMGVLFVAESIRASEASPFRHPGSWIGIGLVLAGATGVAVFPITAEVFKRSREYASLVKPFSSVFSDIALILWCIPYWKRSVTWTR